MFVRSLSDVPRNAVRPLDPEEALFADWTPMIVVHLVRRTCVSAFDANLQSETRFSSSGQRRTFAFAHSISARSV